ncbi:MAG: protein kinase domain-containing protein [Marinicella pacifica]
MTDQDNNIWDSLACDIVDGEISDVDALKQDKTVVHKLLEIARLSEAFGHNKNTDKTARDNSVSVLFHWGHLEVRQLLGEGTHGSVYLAHDPILNRQVALKIIKQKELAPYQARAFIDEARRMAKVRNRHVLAIHGANVFDNKVGFWADWIDGHELSSEMVVGQEDFLNLIEALADALRAVHEAGLVHGDVKPSNVMQDIHGRIILMDFGAGSEQVSAEHMLSGTPRYMAPELFQGEGISPASDVYALGTLLYYIISGQFPVQADDLAGIKQAHKKHAYQCINYHKTSYNKAVCQLVNAMLAPDPTDRPTAENILKQISWLKTAPQRRQKRLIVSSLFLILVSGILFTGWGFYRANKAQQETLVAKQQTDAINAYFKQMLTSASALGTGREVSVADLLLKAQEEVAERFEQSPKIKADLINTIARTFLSLNMLEEAAGQFKQSIDLQKNFLPATHAELLNTRLSLVMVYLKQGEHEAALKICEEILAVRDINPMINNQATIRLAEIYSAQGQFEQAEALLLPLLADIEDPASATSNNSSLLLTALTNNASKQSKFSEAEQYARQNLAWLADYPRAEDRSRIILSINFTINLLEQGKTQEALEILEDLLVDIASKYGKETFLYLNTLVNYAAALRDAGDSSRALAAEEKALALSFMVEGDKADISIVLGTNIANSKVELGLFEEAEQIIRDTWKLAQKELGPDHQRTLTLEYNLAELLNKDGRPKAALQWAQKTLEKSSSALGEYHLVTLMTKDNIAVSYRLLGQNKDALAIYDDLLASLIKIIPGNSPPALLVQSHYIEALLKAGKTNAALKQLKSRLKTLQQNNAADHPEIILTEQQIQRLEPMKP